LQMTICFSKKFDVDKAKVCWSNYIVWDRRSRIENAFGSISLGPCLDALIECSIIL
jgi:hypothetical protein